MGAACCVAAKDRTIVSGPSGETLQRHVRHSPSWSFRWDNRGRVAGEETHANWLNDGCRGNDQVELKSGTTVGTAFASEEGSPIDSLQSLWQKSRVSNGNEAMLRLPVSDDATSRNLVKVKESEESPSVSLPSPVKLSPSGTSVSTSPQSSQSQLLPPSSTPSRCHRHSPGHQFLHQLSVSRVPEFKSLTFSTSEEASSCLPPAWGDESTTGVNGGSSDNWSIPVFSELRTTRRQWWSFDSENSGISLEKISRSSEGNSGSPSIDFQTCGVCMRHLTERSSLGWSGQKIISTNELAVVSVLTCGHVFHAECLEYVTLEVNKYDPACPVCNNGETRAVKMSEKALKAELDLKARKKSRKCVDSDLKSNIWFDHHKRSEVESRGPKIGSSKSMRGSLGKPFLKRRFLFGSKAGKSSPENQSAQRKGFFWARSSKD